MLTKRIIACLDVKDGRVVKGVQFRNHVDMGNILELSQRYADEGVDELVFYDITAIAAGGYVIKNQLVDAFIGITLAKLKNIAHIDMVAKLNAFDNTAIFNIKTGNNPFG